MGVNANVNAEMKRMMKIGNDRYAEHLKKDAELKNLIDSNKAATDARLKAMGAHYKMELGAVRATMKKNRAHASKMLAKESAKLYQAIAKNEEAQAATNEALAAQTRQAKMDIDQALHEAKDEFAQKLGALHKTVVDNDKAFEGKIHKLTGIVDANAQKNEKEREGAVSDAVRKGEQRMQAAQDKQTAMNEATKSALNLKITGEISKLEKEANSQ